jgi:putative transposase
MVENGKMFLNDLGKVVEEEWLKRKVIRENVDLDYQVVMTNHFHGILIAKDVEMSRRGRLKSN